jgi:predicted phosphoadenosine phosphosulfate sulfurtransferase
MAVNDDYYKYPSESVYQVSCNNEATQYDRTLLLQKRLQSVDEDLRWLEYATWLLRPMPSEANFALNYFNNDDFWLTSNQIQELATRINNLRPI